MTVSLSHYGAWSFYTIMQYLSEYCDEVSSYDALTEYAKSCIDTDNLNVAIHILQALVDAPAGWYIYNRSLGVSVKPRPVRCKRDIFDEYVEEI